MVVVQQGGPTKTRKCGGGERVLLQSKGGKLLFLIGIMLLPVFPQFTFADSPGSPMELIRSGTEKALGILRESKGSQTPSLRKRKGEILVAIGEYFNFEEMAKKALGRSWKEQSPEKLQEFARLFKLLLFNTYINRLENYTGSNERVLYDSQKLDGDYALVKTRAVYEGSDNISIDYRLHRDGGQWKVYDVVVEGISFIDNYRSQFSAILSNSSFDTLLSKLRRKVEESN